MRIKCEKCKLSIYKKGVYYCSALIIDKTPKEKEQTKKTMVFTPTINKAGEKTKDYFWCKGTHYEK